MYLSISFPKLEFFFFYFFHLQKSNFKYFSSQIYILWLSKRNKSLRSDRSMKMIQSRIHRGSRDNMCVSFVRCIGNLLKANSKDWAHLEWCAPDEYSREPRSRARRGEQEEQRRRRRARGRRRPRSLCMLTTVGTSRAIDQTRIGRSRIVLVLQGARTWAMAVHER